MIILSLLFLPLINSLIIFFFGHKTGFKGINFLIFFFFILNCILVYHNFFDLIFYPFITFMDLGTWLNNNNIQLLWEFQNNITTGLISFVIITISTYIHIYSMFYMINDNNYIKFILLLNIFTFFMLFLIFSSQLSIMLIGWESVGICSFLLINFWSKRQEATQSAIKALLFNKVGDITFILIIIIFLNVTFDSDLLLNNYLIINFSNVVFNFNLSIINIIGFSLILSAFGKSAQFFFHLWLTDAMEGPTPVSGLIHSATMVIAGVFLIYQTFNIIKMSKIILFIIMFIGVVTTLITTISAITSFDIKRVIANSTTSHIGLMFMALGLGESSISIYHLTTHAYFKAFGFLIAGYLVHLLNNEQDCRLMGGVFNILPTLSILIEYWFIVMLSLPFSSNYYSKELFLNNYWAFNNIFINSFIIFILLFMCFLSIICSLLYVIYLNSWFNDKVSIIKNNLKDLYEFQWLPIIILCFLSLFSQLIGYFLFFIFNSNNLYFFLFNWNDFYIILSLLLILFLINFSDNCEDLYSTINIKKKIILINSNFIAISYFKFLVLFISVKIIFKFIFLLKYYFFLIVIFSFIYCWYNWSQTDSFFLRNNLNYKECILLFLLVLLFFKYLFTLIIFKLNYNIFYIIYLMYTNYTYLLCLSSIFFLLHYIIFLNLYLFYKIFYILSIIFVIKNIFLINYLFYLFKFYWVCFIYWYSFKFLYFYLSLILTIIFLWKFFQINNIFFSQSIKDRLKYNQLYFYNNYNFLNILIIQKIKKIKKYNNNKYYINKNLIDYSKNFIDFNHLNFLKKINYFIIDNLLNFYLYNIIWKGFYLFFSIDNFILEYVIHLNIIIKLSFYIQKYNFNKFMVQLQLNFILFILFFFYNFYFIFKILF